MTLPSNIRVNVSAPFPSQIKATAGVSIGRANGIWTIGISFAQFGVMIPPLLNLSTDVVLVYDTVAQTYFQMPLANLGLGGSRVQRSVTSAPVTIQANDQLLHLNLTAPTTITLPPANTRGGVPLLFKDVGLQATANPVTIAAATGDAIDTLPSIVLGVNGQSISLTPSNDGVNTGWWVE